MQWKDNEGYFIDPLINNTDSLPLDNPEKDSIQELVKEYGENSATELSLIAASFYLLDKFDVPVDDLIEEIFQLEPNYSKTEIRQILEKAGVCDYSY